MIPRTEIRALSLALVVTISAVPRKQGVAIGDRWGIVYRADQKTMQRDPGHPSQRTVDRGPLFGAEAACPIGSTTRHRQAMAMCLASYTQAEIGLTLGVKTPARQDETGDFLFGLKERAGTEERAPRDRNRYAVLN